jgi:hypothetical protein
MQRLKSAACVGGLSPWIEFWVGGITGQSGIDTIIVMTVSNSTKVKLRFDALREAVPMRGKSVEMFCEFKVGFAIHGSLDRQTKVFPGKKPDCRWLGYSPNTP